MMHFYLCHRKEPTNWQSLGLVRDGMEADQVEVGATMEADQAEDRAGAEADQAEASRCIRKLRRRSWVRRRP
jgi:hypothetical protein